MDYGEKTKKVLDIVIEEMKSITDEELDTAEKKEELGKGLIGLIGGKGWPDRPIAKTPPHHSFLVNRVFLPLSEIISTIDALQNIAIYIRSSPYKRQGMSRLSYLKYHIESFLNELYILKERLIAYTKLIERGYKRSQNAARIRDIMSQLRTFVGDAFKSYGGIRGSHVHRHRYSDLDLDRLSALELLSQVDDEFGEVMKKLFEMLYKDIRKKWQDRIEKDTQAINKVLDTFSEVLTTVITQNGKIAYPTNYTIT